jgi:hypothetical protein
MENIAAFVLENRKMDIRPTEMPFLGEDDVLVASRTFPMYTPLRRPRTGGHHC